MQTLSLSEKNAVAANFLKSAKITGAPAVYYTAIGLAYSGTQCAVEKINGERDAVSGIIGGLAAGAVVGLKSQSVPGAVGFGLFFAGARRMQASKLPCVFVFRLSNMCTHSSAGSLACLFWHSHPCTAHNCCC